MATSGHESESINVGGLKDTLQKYKTDISDKKYVKPSGGIPKTDLASAVQTSLGKADSSLQSHQTIKQDGITGATLNRFGTCSTAAATAAKTVAITSGTFSLEAGASVRVKFSNANTAGTPTLNVYNGSTATGAKNIFHKGSQITTGGNKALLAGVCDFVYDGTQYHLVGNYIDTNTWNAASSSQAGYVPQATKGKFLHSNASTGNLEWVDDNNTTYTPQKLGTGIGTCSTSSGTALAVSLTGYELVQNGIVAVTFANDVPANATLNINSKGAKPIYYKGSAIEADTIKADDTVTFGYDGTNYVVTSLGGESGGGSAAGLEIVAASGTTLNAEVGKYYRYDNDVSNLTVTLPAPTDNTHTCTIKFYFPTSFSPNVLFVSTLAVKLDADYMIDSSNIYEVTATYNGVNWMLSSRGDSKILLRLEKTLVDKSIYHRTTTTSGTVTPNYNNEGILINSGGLILDTDIKNEITNKDYSLSLDVNLMPYTAQTFETIASLGGSNTEGGVISLGTDEYYIVWFAKGYKIKATNIGFSYNTWYHIEFRREQGYFKLFFNGTQVGYSDYEVTQNVMDFVIGYNQNASVQSMKGYVKNIVIKLL